MKKTLALLLAGAMALATPLSVSAGSISLTDNRSATAKASYTEADFVSEGYFYENSSGTVYYYVAVTNNSEGIVEVNGTGNALDANGTIVGVDKMSIEVLGPGETAIGYFYFSDCDGVVDVDYTLSYKDETYYKPCLAGLEVSAAVNDSNITVSATNNGEYNAQWVKVYALYLDGEGKVVDTDYDYLTDGDSEIKVGATIAGQLSTREEYADVKLYLAGRSDGSVTEASDFDFSQIDIKSYALATSYATSDYLVVTNNSDMALDISFNGVAKDANGNTIGADDCDINVIGPGETTITYFYFSGVTGAESVEYSMTVGEPRYYNPVISDISVNATINSSNVIATVTNDGSQIAKWVEVYCLFLDADNNLIGVDEAYITDDDYELKPGASLTEQLDLYGKSFDHVELYVTGRADKE